jgi:hypothetical protein
MAVICMQIGDIQRAGLWLHYNIDELHIAFLGFSISLFLCILCTKELSSAFIWFRRPQGTYHKSDNGR